MAKDGINLNIDTRVEERLSQEKPWDRVKLFFSKNPVTHERYPEAAWSEYVSGFVALAAGSYMFAIAGRYGRTNYLKANQVTAYFSKLDAKRKANDAYVMYGLKRSLGPVAVSYVGVYSFLSGSQIIELYRGRSNPLHYSPVGSLIGMISRFVYGPRQMLIGALIGGLIGTQCGVIIVWTQQLLGLTMEKRHPQRVKDEFLYALSPQEIKAVETSHQTYVSMADT